MQHRIFVSGPYTSSTEDGMLANTYRAVDATILLIKKGHVVTTPHLSHFVDQRAKDLGFEFTWDDWMTQCKSWLRSCDALLFLGHSRGADIELGLAQELGLKIYYNIDDVPLAQELQGNPKADTHVPLPVEILRLPHGEGLDLPQYETDGAAGLDLCAAVPEGQMFKVYPGEIAKIPTGICVAIPSGYAGLVLSRSGIATRYNVALSNQPGLVDPDFRGELMLALRNRGPETFLYGRGERLAQLLLVETPKVQWREVSALKPTERADGGWGSTGR